MATLRMKLHKKNSNGAYDVVHFQTSADLVMLSDTLKLSDKITSMDQAISNKSEGTHTHEVAVSDLSGGTFNTTDVKAAVGDDYTKPRIRNISASATDLNAGESILTNGEVVLVYE